MNRNVKLSMAMVAAAMLTACSSMEPDDGERFSGLLPDDFTVAAFAQVNPDVVAIQAAGAITSANTEWMAAKIAESDAAAAKAAADEDSVAFMGNVEAIQTLHTRYLNQVWRGVDSLGKQETESLLRFNKYGTSEDLAFVEGFVKDQVDSNLLIVSYVTYGKSEGRPYRACKDEDAKQTVKSVKLDGVLKGTSTDYSAYSFCQQGQGADAIIYVVE